MATVATSITPLAHLPSPLRVTSRSGPAERQAERLADGAQRGVETTGSEIEGEVLAPGTLAAVRLGIADRGSSLPVSVRRRAENRMGVDFSAVRVHTGDQAARSASTVGAAAFAVGPDIVFGAGRYAPTTIGGGRLLAHELAHVVQQSITGKPVLARQPEDSPHAMAGSAPLVATSSRAGRASSQAPAVAAPSAKTLTCEFHAFIPEWLGKPFKDYPLPTGLKNQASFDAAAAAVPGKWLPEPGEAPLGRSSNRWYYKNDGRGFGGGSHRVGFKGSVNTGDIGKLAGTAKVFVHWCDASERVRAQDTGHFTTSGETGKVDGPYRKTATVRAQTEEHADAPPTVSTIQTKGAAAYGFMQVLSPDIDYDVRWTFRKTATGADVAVDLKHNLFPFYEVVVNGTIIYKYSSSSTGPDVVNLNRSRTWHQGFWPF